MKTFQVWLEDRKQLMQQHGFLPKDRRQLQPQEQGQLLPQFKELEYTLSTLLDMIDEEDTHMVPKMEQAASQAWIILDKLYQSHGVVPGVDVTNTDRMADLLFQRLTRKFHDFQSRIQQLSQMGGTFTSLAKAITDFFQHKDKPRLPRGSMYWAAQVHPPELDAPEFDD